MHYRRIRPSPAVGKFVEFYWILEESAAGGVQRIVPDGRAGIILNFANPFESNTNGTWKSQPECFFVGQITGPLLLRPSGPAGMLGIQFRPQGAIHLLRLPMSQLTDSSIALEDLLLPLFRQLEWVRDLSSLAQAVEAVDGVLRAFAERADDSQAISCAAVEIERSGGVISIKDVADRIGWSTRQLQRRFKDAVGISPKLFGRMQRFQGVFRAMEGGAVDWVSAAAHCAYYDQAHLIRDFREFTGKTPTALLDQEIDLSRRFVLPGAVSHFSKTPESTSR
jgi:AraC-like DNA-binding protein